VVSTDPRVDALAPDAPVAAEGLLHVVVTEAVVGDHAERSPSLRVCPVRGAVVLCGEFAVYVQRDGVMVRDASMEAGLAHGPTGLLTTRVDIYGRWPDDAWLVSEHCDVPPCETTVQRWNGSRWTVVIPGYRSMDSVETIVGWGKAGALLVEGISESRARGLGARSGQRMADVKAVAPFSDGVLAMVTTPRGSTKKHALQLWPASGAPLPPVRLLDLAEADAEVDVDVDVDVTGIAPVRAAEIVLYGYRRSERLGGSHGTTEPYLARFDGKSLTRLVPPPAADVTSYVEEPSGVAWALSTGKVAKNGRQAVWRREASGPWTTVVLPIPYDPASLTRTDDGAVWLLAFGPVTLREDDWITGINAALFSTRAPAEVLALGGRP